MTIPYGHHWLDQKDIQAVIKTLKSNFITQGPKVAEFEERVKRYCGARYAVALSSGTAALHAACLAAGIGQGDEVVTTPITFAASSNAVLYMGGEPIFSDIRNDTCNIDPNRVSKKITKKTRAIIAVDLAGHPADLDELRQICRSRGLILIEDAAHSFGAEYRGRKVGAISDLTILSFHPVKAITTGEGGMVLTNKHEYYDKLLRFRTHGITRDDRFMNKNDGPWYYEMLDLGYNYRLTDIQCALGSSQMDKLDKFIARRREIASAYTEAFRNIQEIITPRELPHVKSAWHIYVIRLATARLQRSRSKIFGDLRRRGIDPSVHYIPVYYHPYYQKLGYKIGQCPIAEEYYSQAMTIPLFPKMKNSDVKYVIKSVEEVIRKHVK